MAGLLGLVAGAADGGRNSAWDAESRKDNDDEYGKGSEASPRKEVKKNVIEIHCKQYEMDHAGWRDY